MKGFIWFAVFISSASFAQDTMTFESVDIEGDRKKAAWTELGARPAWVMPTPVCLPKNFSHHRTNVLPASLDKDVPQPPKQQRGGQNGR